MAGPKVTVQIDAQAAVDLHAAIKTIREVADRPWMVDAELALSAALRRVGYRPTADGEWQLQPPGRRR